MGERKGGGGKKKGGGGGWQICWVTTRVRILVGGEDNEILHLVVIN